MACADVDMDIQAEEDFQRRGPRDTPAQQYYQASEMIPDKKGPLHDLMRKQPAVLGSLQIVSGFLSVGVGILFAVTQTMGNSLFSLFRVSQMTGIMFIFSGFVSNLLFKYPTLLTVSFASNCSCIIVGLIAACLISIDLSKWGENNAEPLRVEVLELCVLVLELLLSTTLCFWFFKEARRTKSP